MFVSVYTPFIPNVTKNQNKQPLSYEKNIDKSKNFQLKTIKNDDLSFVFSNELPIDYISKNNYFANKYKLNYQDKNLKNSNYYKKLSNYKKLPSSYQSTHVSFMDLTKPKTVLSQTPDYGEIKQDFLKNEVAKTYAINDSYYQNFSRTLMIA